MTEKQNLKNQEISQWLKTQQLKAQPRPERSHALSIIIPAYNEQWRLPTTLIDIIDYIDNKKIDAEVIIVDDGSTDATCDTVRKFERIRPCVRLLRVAKNTGKGHAVRSGVLNAYGEKILFTDADGSTPIQELDRLMAALNSGADLAIGSRALASADTSVSTLPHRKYLGRLFNSLVNLIVLPSIADTQCGFKLFTAQTGKFLFERQKSDGFSFDVEILFIAQRAGLKISEVPINWTNAPGSKVNLVRDSIKMFLDIIRFRFRHAGISARDFIR
jgi:dolichyl-phosphate beta-glucosyltransferase